MFTSQNLGLQSVPSTDMFQHTHTEMDFISEVYPKPNISFQEIAFARTLLATW